MSASPLTQASSRREWLFVFLAGFFITNAVTAELISNKLIDVPISFDFMGFSFGPFVTVVGVLPWPLVFICTDLINEFYGKKAIRRLSWITSILISYCFVMMTLALAIPALAARMISMRTIRVRPVSDAAGRTTRRHPHACTHP